METNKFERDMNLDGRVTRVEGRLEAIDHNMEGVNKSLADISKNLNQQGKISWPLIINGVLAVIAVFYLLVSVMVKPVEEKLRYETRIIEEKAKQDSIKMQVIWNMQFRGAVPFPE